MLILAWKLAYSIFLIKLPPQICPELKDRDDSPGLLEGSKRFQTGFDEIFLLMQLIDWLLVDVVALLLIGLTNIFIIKNWF
jgi:hypothetical protein